MIAAKNRQPASSLPDERTAEERRKLEYEAVRLNDALRTMAESSKILRNTGAPR